MFERFNPAFKAACLVFAVVVLYQLASIARRKNPLDHFVPPNLPLPKTEASIEPKANSTNSGMTSNRSRSGPPKMGGPAPANDLPAPVKMRVDRIVESEIFGPVIHPMPMALLGIAGRDVFLRAPNGQTGIIREGEELGGVKLLKIGTNRVLVEHEQQQKELTVFAGFGSESLLPKGKERSIESTIKSQN